jgi:hypothetical protein
VCVTRKHTLGSEERKIIRTWIKRSEHGTVRSTSCWNQSLVYLEENPRNLICK